MIVELAVVSSAKPDDIVVICLSVRLTGLCVCMCVVHHESDSLLSARPIWLAIEIDQLVARLSVLLWQLRSIWIIHSEISAEQVHRFGRSAMVSDTFTHTLCRMLAESC